MTIIYDLWIDKVTGGGGETPVPDEPGAMVFDLGGGLLSVTVDDVLLMFLNCNGTIHFYATQQDERTRRVANKFIPVAYRIMNHDGSWVWYGFEPEPLPFGTTDRISPSGRLDTPAGTFPPKIFSS